MDALRKAARQSAEELTTLRSVAERKSSEMKSEGIKFDDGKAPWHLLPFDALKAVVSILAFGAAKYGDRNWEAGMDWERLYRAAIGHLVSWWECEGPDTETGKSHLWHAACCVLFLVAYEIRGVGTDSRPGMKAKKKRKRTIEPTPAEIQTAYYETL